MVGADDPVKCDSNQEGHWERWEIMRLQDDILDALGRSWDSTDAMPCTWWRDPALHNYKQRLIDYLGSLNTQTPFGFKDPRALRLLPLWLELFNKLQIPFKIILCVRDPYQVASSLQQRNSIPVGTGLLLWLRHYGELFLNAHPLDWHIVNYDSWFQHPAETLENILAFLGISTNCSSYSVGQILRSTIISDLQHNTGKPHKQTIYSYVHSKLLHTGSSDPEKEAARNDLFLFFSQFQFINESISFTSPDAAPPQPATPVDDSVLVSSFTVHNDSISPGQTPRTSADSSSSPYERAHSEHLEGDISRLTSALLNKDTQFSQALSDLNAKRAELETLRNELASRRQEAEILSRSLKEKDEELNRYRSHAEELAGISQTEIEKLEQALEDAEQSRQLHLLDENALNDCYAQLEKLNAIYDEANQQLLKGRKEQEAAVARETTLRHDLAASNRHNAEMSSCLANLAQHLTGNQHPAASSGQILAALCKTLQAREAFTNRLLALVRWLGIQHKPLQQAIRNNFSQIRGFDPAAYVTINPDVAEAGIAPFTHYLNFGKTENRRCSWLFSDEYYRARHMPPGLAGPAFAHFLEHGLMQGVSPHPLFASDYYVSACPESTTCGLPPYEHFLAVGADQGLSPHPLFDAAYYREQYTEVCASGLAPFRHYLEVGENLGLRPLPIFDPHFYRSQHPELNSRSCGALEHFVTEGVDQNALPCAEFNLDFYLSWRSMDISEGVSPVRDFIDNFVVGGCRASTPETLMGMITEINGRTSVTRSSEPTASIVIPVHNQIFHTLLCLLSLARLDGSCDFEVIVVDDASTDPTHQLLGMIPWVKVLRNEVNQGFLRSCNLGAAGALGQYVVLLNNDTYVLPGWLNELICTFQNFPDVGLAGSMLLYPHGQLQEAGGIIWEDGSAWNYGRYEDPSRPEYNYLRNVDYCSGASLAIPKHLWVSLGGFDEHFAPAYGEDSDLAFRVRQKGRRVVYQPLSKLVHFEGISCGKSVNCGVKSYQQANALKLKTRWRSEIAPLGRSGVMPQITKDRCVLGRVLVIDACTPQPDQDAGSLTAFGLMRLLQHFGYKVTFIPEDNFAYIPRYTDDLRRLGIEVIHGPHHRTVQGFLEHEGDIFDLVVVFRMTVAARCMDTLRTHAPSAKLVFFTSDLHHIREIREAELRADDALMLSALETKVREMAVIGAADCTIVHSQYELEYLEKEAPNALVKLYGWCIPVPGSLAPFESTRDIVHLGGYRHPPNVDSALYFLQQIFPLVKQHLPDVKLYIVGSEPPADLLAQAREDVIVTGFVEDLTPYFTSARLSVAPLRYGAGIKGKVATSLSFGRPCVGTSVATEGMGLVDQEHVLVAEQPQDFADAVVRLYTDAALWERLSQAGLRFVMDNYSTKAAMRQVEDILRAVGCQLNRQ